MRVASRLLWVVSGLLLAASAGGQAPESPVLGAPSAIQPSGVEYFVTLPAGTRVMAEPAGEAATLAVLEVTLEAAVLQRRDGWVRVRLPEATGWVWLEQPDHPPRPSPPLPPPQPAPTTGERLLQAVALLGARARRSSLGPFQLVTDLDDPGLLDDLARVATTLEDAYQERYGLPAPGGGEGVVFFSRRQDHDAFLTDQAPELAAEGYATAGVASLAAEGASPARLRALLVHELTHLLNRRAFGARSAPWLEEGMAEDLAYCTVDRDGRLRLGTLGGETEVTVRHTGAPREVLVSRTRRGGLASLELLLDHRRRHRVPPLARLTDLDWRELQDPEGRPLRYAESAFFLRYLLDGENASRREAIRDFLAAFAAGAPGDGEALRRFLGAEWRVLEEGFDRWLRRQGRAPRRQPPGT